MNNAIEIIKNRIAQIETEMDAMRNKRATAKKNLRVHREIIREADGRNCSYNIEREKVFYKELKAIDFNLVIANKQAEELGDMIYTLEAA